MRDSPVDPRPGDRPQRRPGDGRDGARHARPRRPRARHRPVRAGDEGRHGGRARRIPRPVRHRRRPGDGAHRPCRFHAFRHAAALRAGGGWRRLADGGRAQARRGIRRDAVGQSAVARLADAAQGHYRGAVVQPAGQRRRNGADPAGACRRPADARRGDEDAGRRTAALDGQRRRGSRSPVPPQPASARSASPSLSHPVPAPRRHAADAGGARGTAGHARAGRGDPAPPVAEARPEPVADAVPVRSLVRHRRARRHQPRHGFQGAAEALCAAGAHRARPSRGRPDGGCAENAAQRSQHQAENLDEPSLAGVAVARGRRPDAGRGRIRASARRAFLDAKQRPDGRRDPGALSRRQDHRRAHSRCAGTAGIGDPGEDISPDPAVDDDDN